ncbi:MAG: acetyl-CoA carboxylase biotin carboxyl carrier protein [Gemmataceae bacterium]|nr:acetyl-CoA carboxylase biotin carboxyl carrier protein [Gemmataceae bacterium]
MSNNVKKTGPFDVKSVESLVALMTEHDLSEIYLRDGNQHLRLRRGAAAPSVVVPAAVPVAAPLLTAGQSVGTPASDAKPAAAAAKKNLIEIKSETVGTFYAQAKPGEPPYVKVGDRVTPNKVVGQVEVMKTYNEIQANCTGVIVEILVENSKYVEFGEVLFRVDPS